WRVMSSGVPLLSPVSCCARCANRHSPSFPTRRSSDLLPGESVPAPGDQAGMGVPPAGPGGPRGFAGAKGRRLGRKKKVLLGAAGAVVLLGSVGAVAAVVSSGEDEPARRQAEPTVSAAPPAWTVQAGRRLT